MAEAVFFSEVTRKHPEFEALFEKNKKQGKEGVKDLIQYLLEYSPFLKKDGNSWMKSVMEIVRKTSLFFQPQIRTKILNEGWASYWHEKLFLRDDRIRGNEVPFARVNAMVTALPRAGLNPYALGMRLFSHIEELADKGRLSYEFQRIRHAQHRQRFDTRTGKGLGCVFKVREDFSDLTFINTFVDQDFVDRHQLFVLGKRLNASKGVWEYYVKSRDALRYKQMLLDSLYHPPHVGVDETKTQLDCLYLNHHFEGKPLVKEFIPNTMMGIAYLWGGAVKLETTEKEATPQEVLPSTSAYIHSVADGEPTYRRVLYTMEDKKLSRSVL
jgi:stage V sporulation protein R